MTLVLTLTRMIKHLPAGLAEAVLKLKFSGPDSMLLNLIPVPLSLVGRAGLLS